jgi:hypothetical protein
MGASAKSAIVPGRHASTLPLNHKVIRKSPD